MKTTLVRLTSLGVFLALVLSLGTVSSLAQGASTPTAASGLEEAGLPTLDITVTATGYEGIPDELAAGRYLVNLSLSEDVAESGGGIAFIQAPEGMTTDALLADFEAFFGGDDADGTDGGTPIAETDASPEASSPPTSIFNAKYAGGIYAFGGSTQVVVDLTPGEWIAWAEDTEAPQEPVIFMATGEMPADLPEPPSAATVTMAEYVIKVTEGTLSAGPQVIRLDNVGAQPHFLGWFLGPEGMTEAQIQTVLDEEMQAEMSGTEVVYSDLNPEEDLFPVVFTATQSSMTSIWMVVDVPTGANGLACFFPDLSDGIPHAYHGMFSVVDVSA